MSDIGGPKHWQAVYGGRSHLQTSWHQDEPQPSLDLIASLSLPLDAAVVDVGGGASVLVDRLVAAGHEHVTVLDLAADALGASRTRLGDAAARIDWVEADIRAWRPDRSYGLWHDRAVLHFLTAQSDRDAYRATLLHALAPDGILIIGTFAEDGPSQCSGLPVCRYDSAALTAEFAGDFDVLSTHRHEHLTPAGHVQPFTWLVGRRR